MTIASRRTYEDIVDRLQDLDDLQLSAIHTIIIGLTNTAFTSPLDIKTEEQLWEHVDHSLAQADTGIGEDVDKVIDDLMREFTV